ncbi:MAG TPA: bifunctional nuclease domain-containing protein [Herpetosiphonaceae bacterium]|nr:bifunctional nuclease domain-containing protein [Herpetosiphonaceae bacterium]
MNRNDGDTALVHDARAGDKEAFGILLTRHRPMLLALCTRMLGDPVLAEDAAQEAAMQALLSLDRLQRPAQFGSWLSGIGLNICRTWLRYRSRDAWSWEALMGGIHAPEPVDGEPGPAMLAEEADLAAQVRAAVAGLPHGQRVTVLLFYLSGLTHAETAAALGVSVGAVKTRLHNARGTLRRQLWDIWKGQDMANEPHPLLKEARIADIRRNRQVEADKPRMYVVVLEDVASGARLPIWIGPQEAEAMIMTLEQIPTPRPMTYNFAASLLTAAEVRLREVHVSRLVENTYYATAMIETPGGAKAVDARTSDALNLALLLQAPIFVDQSVYDAAAGAAENPKPEWKAHWAATLSEEQSEGRAEIAAALRGH